MKVIILIICLIIERYLHIGSAVKRFSWIEKYLGFFSKKISQNSFLLKGLLGVFVVIFPLCFLVDIFYSVMFYNKIALSGLGAYFLVLAYCFGPSDLFEHSKEYFESFENKNLQEDAIIYREFLGEAPTTDSAINLKNFVRAIFINADCCIFAVIFWYMIFGFLGALIYRLVCLIAFLSIQGKEVCSPYAEAVIKLNAWINWFPTRITALFYVMADGFKKWPVWRKYVFTGTENNVVILSACSPINFENDSVSLEQGKKAIPFIEKTLVLYLITIIILTLGGIL